MTHNLRFFIYALLAGACILGALNPLMHDLHLWTKPALMGFLILMVLISGAWKKAYLKLMTLLALIFSLAGDVLLMMDDSQGLFLFGLAAFLMAHLFYILAFVSRKPENLEIPFLKRYPWVLFLTLAYAGLFYTKLKEGAGHIAWEILVYTLVIAAMFLFAMNRESQVSKMSYLMVAAGALLFMASDSLLGWNRFVESIPLSPLYVLGTYALAQYLIVRGLILEGKEGYD